MHFNNETEMNQCPNLNSRTINLSTSKNCSTSSTDSGVILIDNAAAYKSEIKPTTKDNNSNINSSSSSNSNSSGSSSEGEESAKAKSQTEVKPPRISIEQSHTINVNKVGNNKISPTLSIRSNTISIVSIDENAIDSSCIDSDSELDGEGINDEYTVQKLGQQISYPANSGDLNQHLPPGVTVISRQVTPTTQLTSTPTPTQAAGVVAKQLLNGQLNVASSTGVVATAASAVSSPSAEIGHVAVNNSTDVTFGDKHFYEGPVTIQQFLIDNREKWKPVDGEGGQDNPAYNGGRATANGDAKLNAPTQAPLLCPYLPNTISRKAITITVTFVLFTIILGIILATTTNLFGKTMNKSKLLVGDGDDPRLNIPINSTIDRDNIGGGLVLRFVPRAAWLAQPAQKPLPALSLPVPLVIVLPTNSENCTTQAECVFRVRFRQTFDIESLQQDDIAYNFLIGGDGNVYWGRGWDLVGAHMRGYNDRSLSLAYIGSFRKQKPSPKQLSVTRLLLENGVSLGKIAPNYRLTAAINLEPTITDYKAEMLYESFANFTNWTPKKNWPTLSRKFLTKMLKPQAHNTQTAQNTNVKKQPRELIVLCAILLIVVATVVGYFLWLITHSSEANNQNLHILDRSEWQGEPPTQLYAHLRLPVSNVIIHHTASEGCDTEEICIYRMRVIQTFHMKSLGWSDIGYNFLVGGDGQVYVGRGWHVQGQHVKGYGPVSISIAFIGTFVNVEPPARQIEAAKRLMEEGVRLHKLHPDYHIYAHRQLSPTESPGEKLYNLMKHWPRWTQEVDSLRRLNNETLKFVPRAYWLAQPATQPLTSLKPPIERVRFVAAETETCLTQAECTFRMRSLQTYHIESLQLSDINYNFVMADDGNVYVGRGWDFNSQDNYTGFVLAFMGKTQPSAKQKLLAHELIQQGVRLGHIQKDYQMIDQNNSNNNSTLRILQRGEWLAQPAQKPLPTLNLPVSLVIVMPTNSENCTTEAECVFRVRFRQTFDIESLQQDDIAYNFLIGGDGNVYKGRGWDQVGAHMRGYNDRSLSLAYIGSFRKQKPSPKQLSVTRLLLENGVSLGKIAPNYRLTAAVNLEPTITDYKAEMLYESFANFTNWTP
ncbi:uncharacterized protein LOC6646515 [Drosophila willistoni]|nr:uncharacterized protein LOC6646515 [Drosophila willistoni]